MRVRRGLLFWGLFLIPLGAIPLIVRAGGLDGALLWDVWQLWPLILIGVGAALIIGRTRAALVGTAVIALTLGTIGGVALAAPDRWFGLVGDCGARGATGEVERAGAFSGSASVNLDLRCGSIELSTGDGSEWTVDATYTGDPPVVDASADRLAVRTSPVGNPRDRWTVRLPAAQLDELVVTANAASGNLELGEASLERLSADINAGDVRIVAGSGGTSDLGITMNAGRIRLETGRARMSGSVSVNAGAIDLCVASDIGLRLEVTEQLTFATNLDSQGLSRSGDVWTRPAAAGMPTIDLEIDGNAAALTLKSEGACR